MEEDSPSGILMMKRSPNIVRMVFLVSAVLTLFTVRLGIAVPETVQVGLLAGLVVFLGLPHGALDPLVAYRAELWSNWRGLMGFLGLYLFIAAAALLFWAVLPGLALLAFLLYSAFHFSGDWEGELPRPAQWAAGLSIVSMPALSHGVLTHGYFALLAGTGGADWIQPLLAALAIPAALGLFLAAFLRSISVSLRLELLVLLAAGFLLPPLLFFLVYFCGLHSPRHLLHTVKGERPGPVWGTAVTFTVLTVLLAAAAFPLLELQDGSTDLIRIVFIGLAVLTLPHMLLVEYVVRERERDFRSAAS